MAGRGNVTGVMITLLVSPDANLMHIHGSHSAMIPPVKVKHPSLLRTSAYRFRKDFIPCGYPLLASPQRGSDSVINYQIRLFHADIVCKITGGY